MIVTSKVSGYVGNSIFLPAAGYYNEKGLQISYKSGNYWYNENSEGVTEGLYDQAGYLSFNSTMSPATNYAAYRYKGHSVRAVSD